jgi:hypothetical protein
MTMRCIHEGMIGVVFWGLDYSSLLDIRAGVHEAFRLLTSIGALAFFLSGIHRTIMCVEEM